MHDLLQTPAFLQEPLVASGPGNKNRRAKREKKRRSRARSKSRRRREGHGVVAIPRFSDTNLTAATQINLTKQQAEVDKATAQADADDARRMAMFEKMKQRALAAEKKALKHDQIVQEKLEAARANLESNVARRTSAEDRILNDSVSTLTGRLRRVGEQARAFGKTAGSRYEAYSKDRAALLARIPKAVPLKQLQAIVVENGVLFEELASLTKDISALVADTAGGLRKEELELRKDELLLTADTLHTDFGGVITAKVEPREREMVEQKETLQELTKEQGVYLDGLQLFIETGARTQRRLLKAVDSVVDSPDAYRTIKRATGMPDRVGRFRKELKKVWVGMWAKKFDDLARPLTSLAEARHALKHVFSEAQSLLARMRDGLQRAGLQRARLRKVHFVSAEQRDRTAKRRSGIEVLDVRGGFRSECAKRTSRASVQIYEQRPPPNISLKKYNTHASLQGEILRRYGRFKASAKTFKEAPNECKMSAPVLSEYQRWCYHLFHPYQTDIHGTAFNASAGSGKSFIIALLASTHGRAGRKVFVATKPSLRSELSMAMFRVRADVNIQNMVTGCGVKFDPKTFELDKNVSLTEGGEEEDEEDEEEYSSVEIVGEDEEWETEEGEEEEVDQAYIPSMAFGGPPRSLPSTAGGGGGGGRTMGEKRREKLQLIAKLEGLGLQALAAMKVDLQTYKKNASSPVSAVNTYRKLNGVLFKALSDSSLMANTSWFLDETHRIIAPKADLKDMRNTGNMNTLREAFWKAYEELPREQWPYLGLFTATLISANAVDVVLQLNPLVQRENGWLKEFHRDEAVKTAKGNLTGERMTLVDKTNDAFLNLYFDSNGRFLDDPAIHRRWERLSLGTLSYISMYGDRSHFAKPVFKVQKVTVSKYQAEDLIVALDYDLAEDRLVSSTVATIAPITKGPGRGGKKMPKALKRVRTAAPNVYHIIQEMAKVNDQLKDDLEERMQERDPGDDSPVFLNFKKMVYVPTASAESARYVIEAMEDAGFRSMNPRKSTSASNKSREFRSVDGYTGFIEFIDLDDDALFETSDPAFSAYNGSGLTVKQAYLEIMNSAENHDGRIALIAVISGQYREGISLNGIKYGVVAGIEVSDEFLEQALARIFRFCSSKTLPLDPDGNGWSIHMLMQNLKWPKEYAKLRAKGTIRDAIRASFPNARKFFGAIKFMKEKIREAAMDRKLFEDINATGQIKIPFHLMSDNDAGGKKRKPRRGARRRRR